MIIVQRYPERDSNLKLIKYTVFYINFYIRKNDERIHLQ